MDVSRPDRGRGRTSPSRCQADRSQAQSRDDHGTRNRTDTSFRESLHPFASLLQLGWARRWVFPTGSVTYPTLRRDVGVPRNGTPSKRVGGAASDPRGGTFSQYVEDNWLPTLRFSVRPITAESYARNLRCHALPRIGSTQLKDIDVPQLNRLYADLVTSGRRGHRAGTGLPPTTVRNIAVIVNRVLSNAGAHHRLAINPAKAARGPRVSFASPMGPPRCQQHGTTLRPLPPAEEMISAAGPGVKRAGAGASVMEGRSAPRRWPASRAGGRTRPRL
jgi:hypothetical protein